MLLLGRLSPRVPPGRVGRREPEPGFLKKPQRLSLLKNAYFREGERSEPFPSGSFVFSEAVPSLEVWGPPGPLRSTPPGHTTGGPAPAVCEAGGAARGPRSRRAGPVPPAQTDAGAHLRRDESGDPGICCKNTSHSLLPGLIGETHT